MGPPAEGVAVLAVAAAATGTARDAAAAFAGVDVADLAVELLVVREDAELLANDDLADDLDGLGSGVSSLVE